MKKPQRKICLWKEGNGEYLAFVAPYPHNPRRCARPADRVTDNRDQFRKRWRRTAEATNFTEESK